MALPIVIMSPPIRERMKAVVRIEFELKLDASQVRATDIMQLNGRY